jgi:beta-lactam-binding protein with PASTA domain
VDPADYVGRPEKDARRDLEGLGLTVETTTVDNPDDQEKGTVADVSPSGKVDPDATVTLSVYGDPVKSPEEPDKDKDKKKGKP